MANATQRWCACSGIVCIVLFLIGFWGVAGFIPPPSPKLTGEELAQLFTLDATRIRLGMIVSLFAAALLASWSAAITVLMRRMDRRDDALAFTNLAVGALFVLEFIGSLIIWESMTFRARDPQVLLAMNDTAWLLFVAITSTPVLQTIVIGTAILRDSADSPIFPRWAGYFCYWVAVMFLPGSITVFFHTGPFAWNGLLTWYVPLSVFAIWLVTLSILALQAPAELHSRALSDTASMDRQLRDLRSQLDRLTATASSKE